MPLDLSGIPLSVAKNFNTPFANLKGMLDIQESQQRVSADQRKAQDEQRALDEQATVRAIIERSGGDWETALPEIRRVAPAISLDIEKKLGDARKERAGAIKAEIDNDAALTEKWLGRLRGLPEGDDELYQLYRGGLLHEMPDLGALLPDQYDKARLDQVQTLGITAKEHAELQRQALEFAAEGKWQKSTGAAFATATSAEEWAEIREGQRELGAPRAVLSMFGEWSDEAPARARQLGMTPGEQSTAANQQQVNERLVAQAESTAADRAADNARLDTQFAETQRHNRVSEGTALINAQRPRGGGGRGGGGGDYSAKLEADLATALDRATLNLPGTRRKTITDLANRLAEAGDVDQLKQVIRQAAVETEPVDTRRQIEGRGNAAAALRDIRGGLKALQAAGVSTNVLRGGAEDVARRLGASTDPRLAKIGTQIRDAFIEYRRSLTGVAFGAAEGQDYERLFPNYRNTLPLNMAILDGLESGFSTRDREYWTRKLGPAGAALVGALPAQGGGGGGAAPGPGQQALPAPASGGNPRYERYRQTRPVGR